MAKELITRDKVLTENTWKLEDMYESGAAWEKDVNKITDLANGIASLEGKLGDSADTLCDAMSKLELMCILLSRVSNYAMCLSDEDKGNNKNLALAAKADSLYAECFSKIAFVDPELLEISDETYAEFYKSNTKLNDFKHYIDEVLRMRKYTLSADMEKLMALSVETAQASSNTFGLLSNADMTFPAVADGNGEEVALSHGRFVGMLLNADRNVRKETFQKYYGEYQKLLNTYASLYNGQVKGLIFNARARKYSSTLEASVFANDVPVSVYHNLIEAVNGNLDAMHSYVLLRKKLLGVDELHMYDIYVPMIPDYNMSVTFEEAKATALKALAPLGEDYLKVIKEGFDNRWIDVYENKGKRSGAYETAAYGCHPFVLLNFDNKLDDMFTLVHEMGHAMHSYYSDKALPYFESQYKIFVAEVASTTNELLLLNYLLDNSESKAQKQYLLNHYLDMFKGTLFRQTQFAEFELKTNELVESGDNLNSDNLCEIYLELNRKYYGSDMISDDEISWEWARIPHFYYDSYVYQYATSFATSVAIVEKILHGSSEDVSAYKNFLKSGCTKPPVELLKDVGVDLTTKKPIQEAIEVMRKTIKELEMSAGNS